MSGDVIELTVNGETKSVHAGVSVAGLLEELQISGRKVAVERNLEISEVNNNVMICFDKISLCAEQIKA